MGSSVSRKIKGANNMNIFNKMKEPIFLKESSDLQRQLAVLKELEPHLSPEGQKKIRQDIKYLEYGILGENQIAYELKTVTCRCIFYTTFIWKPGS